MVMKVKTAKNKTRLRIDIKMDFFQIHRVSKKKPKLNPKLKGGGKLGKGFIKNRFGIYPSIR